MTDDIEGMGSGELWEDFHAAERDSFVDSIPFSGLNFGEFLAELSTLSGRADGKSDAEIADELQETLSTMESKRPGDNPLRDKLRSRIQELRGE